MATEFDAAHLSASVFAVPPLARDAAMRIAPEANARLVRRLRNSGVTTFIYGGNANFYHLGRDDYAETLSMMREVAPADGLLIPSAGPDYGKLMDQAAELERARFPLVMVLPAAHPATAAGAVRAVRDFVQRLGQPVLLYVKTELIPATDIGRLIADGLVAAVKYAVPRVVVDDDPYLSALIDHMPAARVISGFGEMPAIGHMRRFGLAGFTAGSVCLAPRLSMAMLAACRRGDWPEAERLQQHFAPFESLRERVDAIGVLHYALGWGGLEDMGEILPALSPPDARWREPITIAARDLAAADAAFGASR